MMELQKSRGLELNGLVMKYRETKEDKYFEELWNKVEPFAFKIAEKYRGMISNENIRELAMVCLFDCCRKHIKEGTNVLTYYGKALRQRYYDFYNIPKTRGNDKLNNEALSLDVSYEDENNYYVANVNIKDDVFFIEDFYEECKLAKNEVILVDLLNIGYKRTEIMGQLKLTSNQYRRIITKVRNKVLDNYDFTTI